MADNLKYSVLPKVNFCGSVLQDWREDFKTDCYFYTEDHDMGATIPWCSRDHKIIERQKCNGCKGYIAKSEIYKVALQIIEEREKDFPAADVVEVVRCKDCKWARWYVAANENYYCHCIDSDRYGLEKTDYCSYGERKDRKDGN